MCGLTPVGRVNFIRMRRIVTAWLILIALACQGSGLLYGLHTHPAGDTVPVALDAHSHHSCDDDPKPDHDSDPAADCSICLMHVTYKSVLPADATVVLTTLHADTLKVESVESAHLASQHRFSCRAPPRVA